MAKRFLLIMLASVLEILATSVYTEPDEIKFISSVVANFEKHEKGLHQEKLYLHFDKPYYSAGDTMWFKAYLLDAMAAGDEIFSQFVYVEFIDSNNAVVQRVKIKKRDKGFYGYMTLSPQTVAGVYTLRAYTNWMRNADEAFFFQKTIAIGALLPPEKIVAATEKKAKLDFDIQFFPEGGSMLAGGESIVAFKAIAQDGLGIDVKGVIEDEQGKQLSSFKSSHKGMGQFSLLIEGGKSYKATVTSVDGMKKIISLPKVTNLGACIQVSQVKDFIYYSVRQAESQAQPLYLLAHSQGYLLNMLSLTQHSSGKLPLKDFPEGIIHFMVMDANGNPVSERLIFIQHEQPANIRMYTKADTYHPRDEVRLEFSLKDTLGKPLSGDFSLSVTDNYLVEQDSLSNNIYSHFLLTSDIKGHIEDPSFYFNNTNAHTKQCLDVLMLTQAWKRFNVKDIVDGKEFKYDHFMEIGQAFSGKVTNLTGGAAKSGILAVFAPQIGLNKIEELQKGGRFDVDGIDFPKPKYLPTLKPRALSDSFLMVSKEKFLIENGEKSVLLNAITVMGARVLQKRYGSQHFLDETVLSIFGTATAADILKFQFAPIEAVDVEGVLMLRMNTRGMGTVEPMVSVNGTIHHSSDILHDIYGEDIKTMELVTGAAAAATGFDISGNAPRPIVIIRTKYENQEDKYNRTNASAVMRYIPLGCQSEAEFYAPKYQLKGVGQKDYRTTIHWDPSVKLNESGVATVSFYASDRLTNYAIILEGITSEGRACRYVGKINCWE